MAEQQKWLATGAALARLLADRRHAWFEEVLRVLEKRNLPLTKRNLSGLTNLAALAYQLLGVSAAVARYVPEQEAQAASEMMYEQVAGEHIGAAVLLVRRYMQMDLAQRNMAFAQDVLKDLLGAGPDLLAVLAMGPLTALLNMEAQAATMDAFGDPEGGNTLMQNFVQALNKKEIASWPQ